jgi:hypothetical protein
MRFLNYVIEPSLRSLQPITHFKINRYPGHSMRHLVWWKLSVQYGPVQHCEYCEVDTGLETICDPCFEHHYCECGQILEDAYGSPGDGLCRVCD